MTSKWRMMLAVSLPAVAFAAAMPAAAQVADGQPQAEEEPSASTGEIVVTAQFRTQNLQDTPIAITATSGEMLEARGQANVTEFAAQVPSLYIQSGGSNNGPSATITLRGIGQSDPTLALEPGVGLYIDDVYYSTIIASNFDLLDLDRIEVLRGPQGTLAGRNSIGGAVKLYSKRPSGEGGGFVQATVGSFNRAEILASADFSLVDDKLFARISGSGRHSKGYIDRIDYGCAFPGSGVPVTAPRADCRLGRQGGTDSLALRGALRWLASERVEVNLIGDYSSSRDDPAPSILIYADRAANGLPPVTENGVDLDSRFLAPDYRTTYGTYSNNGLSFGFKNNRMVWGVSGQVDVELSDSLQLTSITAYRYQKIEYNDDPDQTPLSLGLTDSTIDQRQFTQELRMNADIGDIADVTVGGFYFNSNGLQAGRTEFFPLSFLFGDRAKTDSISGFAHAVGHLAPGLDLTGGIRYTNDRRSYSFTRVAPGGGPAFIVGALDGQRNEYEAERVDYRANISYRASDALMLYAQFSTGYKGGGANPRPVFPNQVVSSGPETLKAYEVGAKADLFDRRVRLNLSLFHNDYSGIQISTSTPFFNPALPVQPDPFQPNFNPPGGTAPAFVIQNAGKGRTRGVELETTIVPVDGLSLDGNVSYLDFEYRRLSPEAIASGLALDFTTPFTPKWKWAIGAQYVADLGGSGSITPRLDLSYQSHVFAYPINSDINRLPQRTLLNGRVTYRSADGDWEASVAVSNITDKKYLTSVFDIATASGVATGGVGRPREWSFSIKRRF